MSTRTRVLERTSVVEASSDAVWARIVTAEGINDEMLPVLRMAAPRGMRDLRVDTVPVGRRVGRCWLFLFGVVPFDYDDLMLLSIEPGRRFHEHSSMASMRSWEHERTLTALDPTRTAVHDRVTFELRAPLARVPGLPSLVARGIARFFAHRHTRLRRHFAGR
ncbi:hypothetical protein [Rhodococcus sp. NPDC059234]|uniref:hypothetical protein n=1 Tax=Rhodococcus sp. NPDC059234 TaxID=3346781 RepID=UPI003672B528